LANEVSQFHSKPSEMGSEGKIRRSISKNLENF
jgi:hypothetical protein